MSYIIEANLGIILLYGIYLLILGKENEFTKQRAALLCGLVCALVFPLIEIQPRTIDPVALTTVTLPEFVVGAGHASAPNILLIAYLAVAFLVAIPMMINGLKIYRLSKQTTRYRDHYFVVESNDDRPSWSFFNLIYIGRAAELNSDDKDLVLKHEMLHGKLLHSVDMLLISLLCIVFWFNPVLWFYRRTMAKVHEFEVDSIIERQHGVVGYAELLAKTALSRNGFLLTHHFNQSFILKRINMINEIKSKISNWKLGALAAVVVIYFSVIACTEPISEANTSEKEIDKSGEIFNIVEQAAAPANGMTKFYEDLASELEYPDQARKMGVEGKVFVEFVVNKSGELSDFKVVKGIGAGCDAAALKAVSKMSAWSPAKHEGAVVRQRMVMPITFKLN